ncbi:MAG: hypothetical protein A2Y73_00795 [Chloroflexi bacterium RBG_13_56_8]|nr:MAG: hypothetical protein A2Y73_00795 [Chloroflexi bacterium RBG_13_56_8]
MSKIPIALQLYTVRDQALKDFEGTVRQVAEMGYAGVEFAGNYGLNPGDLSAESLAELLMETDLRVAGSHLGFRAFERELGRLVAYNLHIDNRFVGVSSLPSEMRNADGYRRAAARMNQMGAELKDAGMVLYYHNHVFEFESVDGVRGADILYGETDPALVMLECDVYWAQYAGADPADLIRAYSGRFPLVHLKDMIGEGEERTDVEVGEGELDFAPIFAASEAQGVRWYIVELDHCPRPSLESARISLENLRKWGKAEPR